MTNVGCVIVVCQPSRLLMLIVIIYLFYNSGAGGTEAQDWAGMLFRMYKRFCERKGFKVTVVEEMPADFGIKSVEMLIEGPYAYGYLAGEKGTHRLVRISPFNAQGKRQTSFAGVETWPVLEEREMDDIVIPDKVQCSIISYGTIQKLLLRCKILLCMLTFLSLIFCLCSLSFSSGVAVINPRTWRYPPCDLVVPEGKTSTSAWGN